MAEANGSKFHVQGSLVRRNRPHILPPETGQAEGPTRPAERRGHGGTRQMHAGVYALLRSAFGLVPSFLRSPDDAEAILRYKPPGPCRP